MTTPDGLDAGTAANVPFADRLADHGARAAMLLPDGTSLSYAALAAAADAVALPPQRCLIALPMPTKAAAIILYLAALRRRYPVILIDAPDSALGEQVIATYAPWLPGQPFPAAGSGPALHPDLAVLLATSGSTGSPKLVRLSGRNIDSNATAIADYLGLAADDRAITSLPLHYSYGLSVLNSHLAVGAAIVLADMPVSDPGFWQCARDSGATHLAGVPYSYELFERVGLRDMALPSLRILTQAGGRLPPDRVQLYAGWAATRGIGFFVMYGQTEATARMAYLPPAAALEHPDCVGVAIPGGSFELRPVPEAEEPGVGELVYRGPNVMLGYAETPADLARGAELAELATGDLARCEADGLYRIVGRRSRFSKLFGLRLSHDEVERWLAGRGVAAVVTGDDQRLLIQTDAAAPATEAAALAGHLGLPAASFVWLVGAVPRLPSGKPDLAAIRRRGAVVPGPPATGASGDVAGIFAATFPGVAIGPNDSFSSLSGDSLNYVTFSIALEDALGFVPDGWEGLSLIELERLRGTGGAGRRWLQRLESDVVVRAAAICGIIMLHAGITGPGGDRVEVGGGATMLMTLFGYNLARFQRDQLLSAARWQVLGRFFTRIILPYYAILLCYLLYKQRFDLESLLLISNVRGRFGGTLEPFWFLEAAVQSLGLLVLVFAVPAACRLARDRPQAFALALLAGAVALKLAGALLLDHERLQQRTLDAVFLQVAIGWAAYVLGDWRARAMLLALAMAMVAFSFGPRDSHMAWMLLGLGTVLFLPRLSLPRLLARPLITVAAASFHIYLIHNFVIWAMHKLVGVTAAAPVIAMSLLSGVLLWWAIQEGLKAAQGSSSG